jgi:formylmethanofuran dehydrogenase subunit C
MTLSLRYKCQSSGQTSGQTSGQVSVPVEVEGLTPTAVCGLRLGQIEKFPIQHGNRAAALADFFDVAGDAGDAQMVFEGDLAGVHWIGAGMSEGSIRVEGHAGRHLGSQMTGGEITVTGDAGDWLGGEMQGGLIRVRGHAGHLVGAAYRGSRRGMTGGTILVGGDGGDEIGHTMRRGTIVIGGRAGDCPGFNLIAGSIYLFGPCGVRPGAGLRRGTIGLFGTVHHGVEMPPLLPTFRRAGQFRPGFLRVTLLALRRLGVPFAETLLETLLDVPMTLFHGDLLEQGRGEILVGMRP